MLTVTHHNLFFFSYISDSGVHERRSMKYKQKVVIMIRTAHLPCEKWTQFIEDDYIYILILYKSIVISELEFFLFSRFLNKFCSDSYQLDI